jgi:putative oxidoreductase
MKKLLSAMVPLKNMDAALLIARLGIALMMLVHGLPKMMHLFSGEPIQFASVMGMGAELSLVMAVFAEVVCSFLLLFGLATRFAVIPLIITMLVAVFYIHSADPFAKQELGLHYLLVYVMLLLTGSGKYSLDNLLTAKAGKTAQKQAAV